MLKKLTTHLVFELGKPKLFAYGPVNVLRRNDRRKTTIWNRKNLVIN